MMDDLDDAMANVEELEARERRAAGISESGGKGSSSANNKELVGEVEEFFSKIKVVAIKLNAPLRVGDVIEIGDDEEAVRQRISSMQINREDVDEASGGESVGIKIKYSLPPGRNVYKMV